MLKVIVASQNPVKIRAAQIAFQKMFPQEVFKVDGVEVPSGVSEQPMSDKETLIGAKQRMENAQKVHPNADYWVGIEGGVEEKNGEMETFAWIVIGSNDKMGKARTSTLFLPSRVRELVLQGVELGKADDIVFNRSNSKQQNGLVGILTDDIITRTTYYVEAAILALIKFKKLELFI